MILNPGMILKGIGAPEPTEGGAWFPSSPGAPIVGLGDAP